MMYSGSDVLVSGMALPRETRRDAGVRRCWVPTVQLVGEFADPSHNRGFLFRRESAAAGYSGCEAVRRGIDCFEGCRAERGCEQRREVG